MSRKRIAPPSKVHEELTLEELEAEGRAPNVGGLDALGDFDGGDDRIPSQAEIDESELELEATDDEELVEGVAVIRGFPPKETSPVRVRWIIPPTAGPAHAHAMLTDSTRTLCFGHRVEGSIYPPADDVPRCPVCTTTLEGLRKAAADG